jgi:hypothetical protein
MGAVNINTQLKEGFPDRLRVKDGVLCMADGSDVVAYLGGVQKRNRRSNDTPMTLMPTEVADRMAQDAFKWRQYQESLMSEDERFCLCA